MFSNDGQFSISNTLTEEVVFCLPFSCLRDEMSEDAFIAPERAEYRYLVQDEDEDEEQYVRHRHYVSPLQVLSRRCILLICIAVATLFGLAIYLGYEAKTLPPGMTRVSTQCGDYRGRHVSPNTLI